VQFDERVFKSNDIRGIYPAQVNEQFAWLLGCSLVSVLGARRIALGRDCRTSGSVLYAALAEGISSAGGDVGAVDLCPLELLHYLMGSGAGFDLAVMVTASHNPARFNGFKLVGEGGAPIGERNGLREVRRWIASAPAPDWKQARPPEKAVFAEDRYLRHALSVAGVPDARKLKVVVDPGNGTGGLLWRGLDEALGVEPVRMNFEPDGRFPAHEPNPARLENLLPLRDRVRREGADIGFAYDGDADRTVAVLADGHIIHGSEVILALFEHLFGTGSSARCAVSMVTSRKVLDFMRARGSAPLIAPVGHAKVKSIMRADASIAFAGEQSGHYFYREFYCCESSLITTLHLLHLAAAGALQPLVRQLPGPWLAPAEEPTFECARHEDAVAACRAVARAGLEMFPGPLEIMCERDWQVARRCDPQDIESAVSIRVDYPDWWFCARPSMTEPVARLSLEARDAEDLETKVAALSRAFAAAPPS